MSEWTKEIPEKPGHYWFYGKLYRSNQEPRFEIVQIRSISNGTAIVANGGFVYREEDPRGIWQRIPEPKLPAEK